MFHLEVLEVVNLKAELANRDRELKKTRAEMEAGRRAAQDELGRTKTEAQRRFSKLQRQADIVFPVVAGAAALRRVLSSCGVLPDSFAIDAFVPVKGYNQNSFCFARR